MLDHFGLIFNFHRQHKAICSSTAIVILLPFGFVWISIPSRCSMEAFGCVAFPVQGDKPGSIPACWAVGGAGWLVVSQFKMKREWIWGGI